MRSDVRMGGKAVLKVFAQGERDVGPVVSDGYLEQGVSSKYPSVSIQTTIAAAGRTDHLVQKLAGQAVPPELAEMGFNPAFLEAQFSSPAADPTNDVVILSAASDLAATHWVHRDRGWIVNPPPGWQDSWPAELKSRFETGFEESGLLSADEYNVAAREVISKVRASSGAHILVFGASTIGEGIAPTYHGIEDDHRLRAHRVNAAQIRLSMALGVSVVDVDRTIANLGGAGEVNGPLDYSAKAIESICEEIAYVLDDIGFFEKRPLVAQLGQEGGA